MKKLPLLAFALLMAAPALPARAASPVLGAHRVFLRGPRVRIGVGVWGWWGPSYYPYYPYGYYPYGYYAEGYAGEARVSFARVKTDVSPEEARLYLDGQYIGTADDFDGWPDYLYLGRGHYKLEFRLSGYESQTVDVDARPGTTVKIDNKLRKLPGGRERGSYDEPVIEGGVRRFFVKRRNVAEPARPGDRYRYAPNDRSYSDDRSTVEDRTYSSDGEESYAPAPDTDRPDDRDRDVRRESDDSWRGGRRALPDPRARARAESPERVRLRLKVSPADAAVYLDDRFIGTAEEVNSLDRGVAVAPGRHTVTISRPGFRDRTKEVEVKAGESPSLELSLEK